MALGGVVLNFTAKTADATRDIRKLDKQLGGLGGAAKKVGGGIGGALGSLSKIGTSLPVIGAAVAGVAGLGAAFTGMAKAAYDDANAQAKLERTLKQIPGVTAKAAKKTGDWIDKMELATLVADDDLRVALGRLALVTEDLGEAQKLAALAQDAAVGSGKNFLGVAQALAKAADGNTAALQRQFPELDAGKDKVLTLAEAVQQLTDKYGGAADAAADKDVFGRISVAFRQIGEAIGTAALPLLQELADWFADKANIAQIETWIGQLETWATTLGETVVAKVQEFYDWLQSPEGKAAFEGFMADLRAVRDTIDEVARAIENLIGWIADLIDKWQSVPGFLKGPLGQTAGIRDRLSQMANPQPSTINTPKSGKGSGKGAGSMSITVNNYNPKPERSSASTAAALRQARASMSNW